MIIENLKEGFKEGELEGRCTLISTLLLSLSIYASNFEVFTSLSAMAISLFFSRGKVLRFSLGFLPVIVLIFVSSLLSGFKVLLAFLAILFSGALLTSSRYSEIVGAPVYFKLPEKFVSYVSITLSILPVVLNDLQNVKLLYRNSVKGYLPMLKAFVSATILRSMSVGETLYSKCFDERTYYEIRKPKLMDFLLLSLSLLLFSSTVLPLLPFPNT